LAELLAMLSLANDLGLGQPMEYLLRSCLLATKLGDRLGLRDEDRHAIYYTALLRWLGCTGHAHEASLLFGDEISARARLALIDQGNPREMLRLGLRDLGAGQGLGGRLRALRRSAEPDLRPEGQFRASCEVAQLLSERLGVSTTVKRALWHAFERWDGRGVPEHVRGDAVEIAARVVLVAQDGLVFQRTDGIDVAVDVIRLRSGQAYDPAIARVFCDTAADLFDDLDQGSAWERVLAIEPPPQRVLARDALEGALEAVADYVDLKSPWTAGHSRGVAQLAARAAEESGMPTSDCVLIRRAGLLHDLGRCGVHNGIWDKPGPLTDAEWERVRLHPYLTGRLLSRSPALTGLAGLAAAHHERSDGSGYYRGARAAELPPAMRLLAAADAYQAMSQPRPHRPSLTPDAASTALRDEVRCGRHNAQAVEAVLAAAGYARPRRGVWPDGLSNREVQVLRLVARGLPNRETARMLSISERTVAHHIQHAYDKIGVSTRGAVVLYALQHDLVEDFPQLLASDTRRQWR
jgi:HD-GYP domain-containing protein (c-di-GMP phosphodiesterase class II)/DNA-binding CsgD family transcriptional regulator